MAKHVVSGDISAILVVAQAYKNAGIRYCIIGHNNYKKGSSCKIAILELRYLCIVAIITNGFGQIYKTNLNKQGIFSLTFADPKA